MDWEKKFTESRQPKVKLEIALSRLMESAQAEEEARLPGKWEEIYRAYLAERSHPALMQLAGENDPARLREFLSWRLADREQCARVLRETQVENPEIRLLLMGLDTKPPKREISTEEDAARQAWELTGTSLAADIPYLHLFFAEFQLHPAPAHLLTGTDGLNIFLQSRQVAECFCNRNLRELYLHIMIHVLYGHVIPSSEYPRKLWDLSCQVSAWQLQESVFGLSAGRRGERKRTVWEQIFPSSVNLENVVSICAYLQNNREKQQQVYRQLEEFPQDAHDYWYEKTDAGKVFASGESDGGFGNGLSDGYRERAEYLKRLQRKLSMAEAARNHLAASSRPRRFGLAPGSRQELLELKKEGQYDFRRYLSRFASVREEMQIDEDSFDYAYYLLGIKRYGNMPLVEPLEYMEARRVDELVIAIDTSRSCSVEVVRRFLEETRNLLTRRENFFRRMNVHIIQCDSMIQQHRVITSVEDWQRYERELAIVGRGGTDFTPVFTFVEKLRTAGELKNLKGLLYFTDGDGIYPRTRTDYETIFVFTTREFLEGETAREIPSWVVKLCLDLPHL